MCEARGADYVLEERLAAEARAVFSVVFAPPDQW